MEVNNKWQESLLYSLPNAPVMVTRPTELAKIDCGKCKGQSPSVLVIVTGGTVSMVTAGTSQALTPKSIGTVLGNIPEFEDQSMPCCQFLEWEQMVDSSDIGIKEWCLLCDQIYSRYDDYDGFVIIHGTDTMAFTASALSFMLEDLNKPVVLTGAMLPIHHMRTDARRNLTVAAMIAGHSRIAEVCLVFGSKVLRGNRSRKFDCFNMDAFDSPNFPPLGQVGIEIICDEQLLLAPSKRRLRIFKDLCPNVFILKLTPGLSGVLLEHIFSMTARPYGIVMELYGTGTAPVADPSLIVALEKAINSGIQIAAVTQCMKGPCSLVLYENGERLHRLGVIDCKDMTPEAALTKMSYFLGRGLTGSKLRSMMESNLRGETTSNVFLLGELSPSKRRKK